MVGLLISVLPVLLADDGAGSAALGAGFGLIWQLTNTDRHKSIKPIKTTIKRSMVNVKECLIEISLPNASPVTPCVVTGILPQFPRFPQSSGCLPVNK